MQFCDEEKLIVVVLWTSPNEKRATTSGKTLPPQSQTEFRRRRKFPDLADRFMNKSGQKLIFAQIAAKKNGSFPGSIVREMNCFRES